jgi:hypothetical protein
MANIVSTYSFKGSTGVYSNPGAGIFIPLVGGNHGGIGTIVVTMDTDRSELDIAADGGVMGSYIPGDNGKVEIEIQQTSTLHELLLNAFNLLKTSADNGDPSNWYGGRISMRNIVSLFGHNCAGVAFTKIPPVTYTKQGQMIRWELMCAQIINS